MPPLAPALARRLLQAALRPAPILAAQRAAPGLAWHVRRCMATSGSDGSDEPPSNAGTTTTTPGSTTATPTQPPPTKPPMTMACPRCAGNRESSPLQLKSFGKNRQYYTCERCNHIYLYYDMVDMAKTISYDSATTTSTSSSNANTIGNTAGNGGSGIHNLPPNFLGTVRLGTNPLRSLEATTTTTSKRDMRTPPMWSHETPKPKQIVETLSQFIIGQEYAKMALAVAVYNHYKRVSANLKEPSSQLAHNIQFDKSNILMCGPTGSGKTLLARTMAKMLNVPIAIADCTTLTQAGYVGEDAESVVVRLLNVCNGNVEMAQRGIVFLDEVDKISGFNNKAIAMRDVSGEGVQQSLLKLLEGSVINVPEKGGKRRTGETQQIDTTNILFIASGAFNGLEETIVERTRPPALGFGAAVRPVEKPKQGKYLKDATPEDFTKFGLIPEFIGRFPCIVPLEALTAEDLERVLTEPKDSLVSQFQTLFALDGAKLTFEEGALHAIANVALKKGTGARGLRAIFEKMLMKAMLDVPGGTIYEVKVTVAVVEGRGEPEYVERSADDPPVPVPGAATGDAAEDEEDAGAAPLYARSI